MKTIEESMKTIEERAKEYGSKKGDVSLSAIYNEDIVNIYKKKSEKDAESLVPHMNRG